MITKTKSKSIAPVIYLPHGGGPLPILGDDGHKNLVTFLYELGGTIDKPSAILVISAHWEEDLPTITSASHPDLIYDYYGFPPESYEIQYPAAGNPGLAETVYELVQSCGMQAQLDDQRGFDHGLFIPLKLVYPNANIPCIQLSLLKNLNAQEHIALGKSLSSLREKNVLIIGSGLSFHNMQAFSSEDLENRDIEFDQWLMNLCTNPEFSPAEREKQLIDWEQAPHARYCHPREEHLLPLHVCYGAACAESPVATLVFNRKVMGKQTSALLW